MNKIFIVHSNMKIGGAESSLLGLLKSIDYNKYRVDLLLLDPVGELLSMLPAEVKLLTNYNEYNLLLKPIKDVVKQGKFGVSIARIKGKIKANKENRKLNNSGDLCYLTKQYSHKYSIKHLPKIEGKYDIGISFIDPHYILQEKVNAKVKLGWLHTDFSRINVASGDDLKMWSACDYIVSVSDACKSSFDKKYPQLKEKSIVIENILPKDFVVKQSLKLDVSNEMKVNNNEIKICSVGRFSDAKNFDNVPKITKLILDSGCKIKWFLIGYGSNEVLIKEKIKEEGMEDNVIILGKKNNPYPYIKECDIYVQPSRYEGKAVTVREAQMLNKPVVITKFSTSRSQLKDGIDGIIVSLDNEGCARGIIDLIRDKNLQNKLIENTKENDYSNMKEVQKIYDKIK